MKDITNEKLFLTVVEAGSFKQAAEIFAMDPSLVSRRMTSLEKRLGVKLIERSTKHSTPTEAGHQYANGLKKLLEEQSALENSVCGTVNTPSGHLKVAAPHDFGTEFVSSVLERMVEKHPDLSVELVLGSQFEDLKSKGIDVAVRIGELSDSSLICRRVGDVPRVLVASPKYIAEKGMPKAIKDLESHEFVLYAKNQMDALVKISSQRVKLRGKIVVNSVSAIRQLLLNHRGMHIGPVWAFKKELAAGHLIRVLPNEHFQSYPLHALYISRSYVPAKVRVFIDSLIETYGNHGFE